MGKEKSFICLSSLPAKGIEKKTKKTFTSFIDYVTYTKKGIPVQVPSLLDLPRGKKKPLYILGNCC
jgi:hypothetical protein